jgi:hypothetical protein
VQPKTENQTAKQPKHEVRKFERPHPHKENKTDQHKTKLKQLTLHSTSPTLTKRKNRAYWTNNKTFHIEPLLVRTFATNQQQKA